MVYLSTFFLLTALSAYLLFGGADFGAGILEYLLPTRRMKARLAEVVAPVWEANHVWLIAVVVILFVGFPGIYSLVLTRLYLPISLALLVILIRGTFFTLRKYDPQPGQLARLYSWLFRMSSALAPLCFGFVLSGLLHIHPGNLERAPDGLSAYAIYVAPWFNAFGLLVGFFIASLFTFLAAVFFYGELRSKREKRLIGRIILGSFASTFVSGGVVLLAGAWAGLVPTERALHPLVICAQLVALLSAYWLYAAYYYDHRWHMRLAAGAQLLAVLAGWFAVQTPAVFRTTEATLWLNDAAAPPITLLWLNIGLVVVLASVVPLLVILYRVFDAERPLARSEKNKPKRRNLL